MNNQNQSQTPKPVKDSLLNKTKKVLSSFAQKIGLKNTEEMSKTELVQSLEQREKEVKPMLAQTDSATATLKNQSLKQAKQSEINHLRDVEKQAVLKEVTQAPEQHAASSRMEEPQFVGTEEPADTWHGETGPEMPRHYGRTMLYAMPRDPNWIYLYWEISDDSKREVQDQNGEWIFETSTSIIRVYDEQGNVYQEVPVLLDAMGWYMSLPSSRDFHFELGLNAEENFIVLAKSNKISLSQAKPSDVIDEEWAVVEERFKEMLEAAASGRAGSLGASENVMPHLVTERFRIPWDIPNIHQLPSSHEFVSSHSISSHTLSGKPVQKRVMSDD